MFTLTSKVTNEVGRLTRQFLRCTRDSSAAVDCAFLLGAMARELKRTATSRDRKELKFGCKMAKLFRVPGTYGAGCYAEARLTCRQAGVTQRVPTERTDLTRGWGTLHVLWLRLTWLEHR